MTLKLSVIFGGFIGKGGKYWGLCIEVFLVVCVHIELGLRIHAVLLPRFLNIMQINKAY